MEATLHHGHRRCNGIDRCAYPRDLVLTSANPFDRLLIMGYYIETPQPHDKDLQMIALHNASVVMDPTKPVDSGYTLLCVVKQWDF